MKLTVLGIGQTIRGDDGAGIAAVRQWQQSFPETAGLAEVSVQYSELSGLSLLDLLEGFDAAVVVDAVEVGDAPGAIYRLGPGDLAAFTSASKSAHGWGVAETLALGQRVQPTRRSLDVRLVGIAAEQMQLGTSLSDAVERALPAACRAIEAEVRAFLAASGPVGVVPPS